ncbi:MAG TPA: hypothetical protein VEK13_00990 [Thermoplasmata archaeon]|nr:hypothetical protein [Thermoplasmata archaeon]
MALALTVPSAASGSLASGSPAFPPLNTCVIPFLPCYIVLSIDSGSHGNKETVTGAQFYPGEPFTVYFWNGTPGASAAVVASGSTGTGSFAVSFRIPNDPVGSYTIFVTDLAGDNQSASFQLTHLHASPSSGSVGNTTVLSGQGFLPDHVMKFHLHGVHASTTAPCRTDQYGNFSGCRITIPNVPTGTTLLKATDGTYTARIGFVVT